MEKGGNSRRFENAVDTARRRTRADGVGNSRADGDHIVAVSGDSTADANAVDFRRCAVGCGGDPVDQVPFNHVRRSRAAELNTRNYACGGRVGIRQIKDRILRKCRIGHSGQKYSDDGSSYCSSRSDIARQISDRDRKGARNLNFALLFLFSPFVRGSLVTGSV